MNVIACKICGNVYNRLHMCLGCPGSYCWGCLESHFTSTGHKFGMWYDVYNFSNEFKV